MQNMIDMLIEFNWLSAQSGVQTGYAQAEYLAAYGLIIGMVLLGLLAVCVPRPREKNFVEPEEVDENSRKKRR